MGNAVYHDPAASHEAGAFHPDLAGGRASGQVRVVAGALEFESEGMSFRLPLQGLEMEAGGAANRLVFFKHPEHAGKVIHTADRSILDHACWGHDLGLMRQRGRLVRGHRASKGIVWGVLAAFVVGLVALYAFRDTLVRTAAKAVPAEWEIQTGDWLFERMMVTERLVEDEQLAADLEKITGPLIRGISDRRYPLKFHIIEDPSLNAFAMPGGNVVLHSGLLLAAGSPEEVAGVLAHEIAHVTQRHGIRGILSSAGLYLVVQTLLGDVTGVVAVLKDNGQFLLSRQFSREFEREADERAWEDLQAANISPEGMIRFFERMLEEEKRVMEKLEEITPGEDGGRVLQLASTHPATRERIDSLTAKWQGQASGRVYQKLELPYPEFQERLRTKLHTAPSHEKE